MYCFLSDIICLAYSLDVKMLLVLWNDGNTQYASLMLLSDQKNLTKKKEVKKKKNWQPNIGLIFSLKNKFRIESPEIGPNKYSQLIFDELVKTIQWSKDSLFNKCCWNNGIFPFKKMNLDTDLRHFTKII